MLLLEGFVQLHYFLSLCRGRSVVFNAKEIKKKEIKSFPLQRLCDQLLSGLPTSQLCHPDKDLIRQKINIRNIIRIWPELGIC